MLPAMLHHTIRTYFPHIWAAHDGDEAVAAAAAAGQVCAGVITSEAHACMHACTHSILIAFRGAYFKLCVLCAGAGGVGGGGKCVAGRLLSHT